MTEYLFVDLITIECNSIQSMITAINGANVQVPGNDGFPEYLLLNAKCQINRSGLMITIAGLNIGLKMSLSIIGIASADSTYKLLKFL
jgi:hypothetical protein